MRQDRRKANTILHASALSQRRRHVRSGAGCRKRLPQAPAASGVRRPGDSALARLGRKPLVARFGGIPLQRQRNAVLTDLRPVMASSKRNELIHRLLADRCEICDSRDQIEVHHIRKLADLNRHDRPDRPTWVHLMDKRRRKTIVICRPCHEDIHAGRHHAPTRN
jgi:hypothetical protein